MELRAFHSLAAACAPTLNISVNQALIQTATTSQLRFAIQATGPQLAEPVKVSAESESAAVAQLRQALAKDRRRADTEAFIARLQAPYLEHEIGAMRGQLLNAYGRASFDALVVELSKLDKARYDAAMGQAYEAAGHYDQDAA